jgi:hypothetical protein
LFAPARWRYFVSTVNIFFDIDYTILSYDQALRRGTQAIFARLVEDGHQVYVWSGEGVRWSVVRQHDLEPYVSGVFAKPLSDFAAGLTRLQVSPTPDFVIDDYPEIVGYFGGYFVPEFYSSRDDDDELESVYQVIVDLVTNGHATHHRWRPRSADSALLSARDGKTGSHHQAVVTAEEPVRP